MGRKTRGMSPEEFWSRVSPEPNTGCWIWNPDSTQAPEQYGIVKVDGWEQGPHRHAWELANGKRIPLRRHLGRLVAFVCQHCDNRWCVNPKHLYLGNAKTNAIDIWQRSRKHHRRPLSA